MLGLVYALWQIVVEFYFETLLRAQEPHSFRGKEPTSTDQ
jgi:hypothetical protein